MTNIPDALFPYQVVSSPNATILALGAPKSGLAWQVRHIKAECIVGPSLSFAGSLVVFDGATTIFQWVQATQTAAGQYETLSFDDDVTLKCTRGNALQIQYNTVAPGGAGVSFQNLSAEVFAV